MSGRSARSIQNFSLELSQDLVLPNVWQVDIHDFRKHLNFNVLEMALKTFHIVQGLSRTPLLFIPRYLTNMFPKNKNSRIESMTIHYCFEKGLNAYSFSRKLRSSQFPGKYIFWGSFFKMDFRRRPFNQKPLVFRKKSKDPSGGPRIIW